MTWADVLARIVAVRESLEYSDVAEAVQLLEDLEHDLAGGLVRKEPA